MGLYILLSIWLAITTGIILCRKTYDDSHDPVGSIVSLSILCGIIITLGFAFAICHSTSTSFPVEHKTYCKEIVSMRNGSSISGSFFLGCGSIGSTQYYVYYEKQDNGSYKRRSIEVNDAAIFEEENCKPRIHWEGTKYLTVSWFVPKWAASIGKERYSQKTIYVPKGTIIQEFKLN